MKHNVWKLSKANGLFIRFEGLFQRAMLWAAVWLSVGNEPRTNHQGDKALACHRRYTMQLQSLRGLLYIVKTHINKTQMNTKQSVKQLLTGISRDGRKTNALATEGGHHLTNAVTIPLPVLAVCHAASHTGTPRDTDLLAFLNSKQATPGHTGTLISQLF